MAILKHIKSRNANYSDTLNYLLYQHDEKTGKQILDDYGRKLLREEFYMDGLNCAPLSFDKDCWMTNNKFHKNQKKKDIKSHHYIISFDPADVTECGLTGKRAQELCLNFARKNFPGYQAVVVTHTDGGYHTGNIHTHIVINSVRKYAVERRDYMDKPNEEKAGYKHRSTKRFLNHLKKEVMEMCEGEGLHQIDLLSPAPEKLSEKEFRAKSRGQKKLEEVNQKIEQSGMKPASTIFQTQKDELRNAIERCSEKAKSFEEFQALLLEEYNISVLLQRSRYRYLHPGRDRRITEKALGTHFGKEYLEQCFSRNRDQEIADKDRAKAKKREDDYQKDPLAIFTCQSRLRLVVDLQTNVKAIQSQAYAQKVRITNLQQMAETLIYVLEHGYDSRADLDGALSVAHTELSEQEKTLGNLASQMKTLNSQIHYTGQYYASKKTYSEFLKSKNKRSFKKAHEEEIRKYLEARDWLKTCYPDGKMLSLKSLKEKRSILQGQIDQTKTDLKSRKASVKELETAVHHVDAILNGEAMFARKDPDQQQEPAEKTRKTKQKEESL